MYQNYSLALRYELVNINTHQKPEWYFEKNPDGLVPTLEQDGKLVQESLVTSEYLDEIYPDTAPMFPTDPYLKAKDKLFIQNFGNVSWCIHIAGQIKETVKNITNCSTDLDIRFFAPVNPCMPWNQFLPLKYFFEMWKRHISVIFCTNTQRKSYI